MNTHKGCVQKNDEMKIIYEDLNWADVIVFASPQYWGTFTAELKKVIDRMFGWITTKENLGIKKECVLLMTARGNDYSMALVQYNIYIKYLGWKDLGMALGRNKENEAKKLGGNIK